MEDPRVQELRNFFNTLELAAKSSLDQLETLTETLRVVIPGFSEEHKRQLSLQVERRDAQKRDKGPASLQSRHQPVDLLQDLFGKK